MPASSVQDPATGIWTIRLSGIVTAQEAMDAARTMFESPGYDPDAPRMWDARNTDPDQVIEPQDLRGIAAGPEAKVTTGRVAILVGRDIDFGMSRMFQAYNDQRPANIQVFRDFDEALAWLREDA